MNRKRIRGRVIGKVQGVFYRASAKSLADDLGITGWVRNSPDGSVEFECQGMESDLEKFLLWTRKGPDWARVDSLEQSEIHLKEESAFEIIR